MGKNNQATCPHCMSKATARSSKKMTVLTREVYYQCTDVECGHTWVAQMITVRTLVPSRKPNPDVFIPQSERYIAMAKTPPRGN